MIPHPLPDFGDTSEYLIRPRTQTLRMQPPARLPADAIVLPALPANAEEVSDLAALSLREPSRCWTIAGSRDHIAAVCALAGKLERALRAADDRCDDLASQMETAQAVAIAAEHGRRHEMAMRLQAELQLDASRNAHQGDILLLEASELRVEDDGKEILRLTALAADLSQQNAELRHRLIAAGLQLCVQRFDLSDADVVDVEHLDEPAPCRVTTVRIPIEPMAAIVETGR
jgi:hypothetical protein